MKYREKLLELIFDDNALIEYIEAQPLLDQADIMREFKELANKNSVNINEILEDFDQFDKRIDLFEDAILDEKLAEANLIMAQEELDKKMLEMDEVVAGVRGYVMDCIVNNEENAEAMKELAEKLMQSEKDDGIFDPTNWSRIL